MVNDDIQHGIDDNPVGDGEKGAALGGVGGAVTGGIAGSLAGPVGTVIGAVVGGVAGALGSGAAVAAVDRHDNDDNITGVGDGVHYKGETAAAIDNTVDGVTPVGNGVPGIQTGGHDIDGTPDSRGMMEKTADALTGDRYDDKKGEPVA